jgi:hypothetical protein
MRHVRRSHRDAHQFSQFEKVLGGLGQYHPTTRDDSRSLGCQEQLRRLLHLGGPRHNTERWMLRPLSFCRDVEIPLSRK